VAFTVVTMSIAVTRRIFLDMFSPFTLAEPSQGNLAIRCLKILRGSMKNPDLLCFRACL
jgi:hypothetical protein